MKVVSELYKLIKRVDKLTETIEALEKENKALREDLAVVKDTTENRIVEVEVSIDDIVNFNGDLLNRIETLEIDKGIIRERRKK